MNDALVAEEGETTELVEVDTEAVNVDETLASEEEAEAKDAQLSESSTDEKDKEQEDKLGKAQEKIDKRIGEYTKLAREAERDRDYWKNLAQQERAAPAPVESGKTLADFEYDEKEYASYLVNVAKAEANAEVETRMQQERQARTQADFSSKESEFSKEHDDYHQVTRSNDLRITPEMVQIMSEADDGPAVLYHLGKNPEIAARLANMPVLQMAREIGRIEAIDLREKPVEVTKAPAPVPKISGVEKSTSVKADSPDSDKLSTEEWLKRRNKQIASN